MARHEEFVQDARRFNRMIWEGLNNLAALQREWSALDYGTTMPETVDGVARADVGAADVGAADVGAAVFATADAIEDLLATGHATNMAKLL